MECLPLRLRGFLSFWVSREVGSFGLKALGRKRADGTMEFLAFEASGRYQMGLAGFRSMRI